MASPPKFYQRIYDFLQGAVYCWCKNRSGYFGLRDLMGGTNYFWARTPLIALWNKHKAIGLSNDDAVKAAAKDRGRILKRVIADDHVSLAMRSRWAGRVNSRPDAQRAIV